MTAVTDKKAYLDATKAIGVAWKDRIGSHYPAMTLVEVRDLLEEGAWWRSRRRP